jgi:quercetin dioxygenase-like cupin family protein
MTNGDLAALPEKLFSPAGLFSGTESHVPVHHLTLASRECGATAFSTRLSVLEPGGRSDLHNHGFSKALTVVQGEAEVQVEGRAYRLDSLDCVHIPALVSHSVSNADPKIPLIVHTAFASPQVTQRSTTQVFPVKELGRNSPLATDPETILRSSTSTTYELSENAFFHDLFARRYGAVGICGGYGRFLPGASLPCHTHNYDESITIVKGAAVCLVAGRQYELGRYHTAFIPKHTPHRFLNHSENEMAMIWVYAGDEPDRDIVDAGYCSGSLTWARR